MCSCPCIDTDCILVINKVVICRIFSMDTVIADKLYVSYTYKAITEGQFDLQLTVVSSDGTKTIRFHLADNDSLPDHKNVIESTKTTDVSINSVEDIRLEASGSDDSSCGWVTRSDTNSLLDFLSLSHCG